MQGEGAWIWFEDEVRGPYPEWEIQLIASKCRHFLVLDGSGRWVRYPHWDGRSLADEPSPPSAVSRWVLALSRAFFRRFLRVHH